MRGEEEEEEINSNHIVIFISNFRSLYISNKV
jgi:hypothetical protein